MSPNPTNAILRLTPHATDSLAATRAATSPDITYAPGREALQALLAFSALHQQIRQRRTRQVRAGAAQDAWKAWEPERFVLDEVLHLVGIRALTVTGADGVAIAMAEGDEILCRAAIGRMAPPVGTRLDPRSGFSGTCFRTGLIVRCDDAQKDPRVDPEACLAMGLHSMVAVPLTTEHGVIGLIAAFCSEAFGFNDSDVRSLSLLAELILAALQPEEEFLPEPVPEPARTSEEDEPGFATKPELVADKSQLPAVPDPQLVHFETLRGALARVTEENEQAVTNSEPVESPAIFSQYQTPKRSWLGIAVLLLLLLLVGIGVATWWQLRAKWMPPAPPRAAASVPETPDTASSSTAPATAGVEDNGHAADSAENTSDPAAKRSGPLPELTGVRHWSSADSSTVAIDLQEQVQYEAHRLSNPERIYFDLHDTDLAPGVPNIIDVGDPLLLRIRIAQPEPGITRVVLETKQSPNFSVSMGSNPYRLMVEVRSITAKPEAERKIELFTPADRYAMNRKLTEPRPEVRAPAAAAVTAENVAPAGTAPKFRIVLDAGHGGWDMGTVGRQGLLEKDLVMDIVSRVGNLIESRLGAEVIYTRHDDTYVSLEKRTEIANLAQADMFLSVHANYSDLPSARGVETYFTDTFSAEHASTHEPGEAEATNVSWNNVDVRGKARDSRRLAVDVQRALHHSLAPHDPGLRDRGVKQASYVVLTGTTMPAVLTEVSFVSSPSDETSLHRAAYRQQIAEALYKGVAEYAGSLHRVNLASALPRQAGQ